MHVWARLQDAPKVADMVLEHVFGEEGSAWHLAQLLLLRLVAKTVLFDEGARRLVEITVLDLAFSPAVKNRQAGRAAGDALFLVAQLTGPWCQAIELVYVGIHDERHFAALRRQEASAERGLWRGNKLSS